MEHVHEVLKELGDDPDTIARTLYDIGIRGIRRDCAECPVSNYLRLRGFLYPTVSACNITYAKDNSRALVPTPDAVSEFMRRFDRTEYPHLIKISYY